VVRESTGKEVTVPLFFLLESILKFPLRWALGRFSFGAPAFFAFNRTITTTQHGLLGGPLMPIDTADIFGSDQVGIHLATVGNVLLHPLELPQLVLDILETTLQLEMHAISVGGSNLIGALVAGNSRGMAVADIATESDIDMLTSFGDVVVMEGGVNTAGNLLLVNEQGAIASPSIPTDGLEIMAEVMGVQVAATTIAGQDVVGSLGVTNDQGVLLHPDVTPDEVVLIESVLGVAPMVGTVAFGSPYVGAGVCANNNGAVAGTETTGPELNRLEDALGLI
jgi:translation initiation factor 6